MSTRIRDWNHTMGETKALQAEWPLRCDASSSFCGFLMANGTNTMNRHVMARGILMPKLIPRNEYFGNSFCTNAAKRGPNTAPIP